MTPLGRFLEFSVHTNDVLESLRFYTALGFVEMSTLDVWTHRYAVVSDGELSIGLHDREFDAPAITFVHPDVAGHVRAMADHSLDTSYQHLGDTVFNEAGMRDHDGHAVTMVEARTFNASTEPDQDSLCGNWFEISLPVRDAIHAAQFWAPLAPEMVDMREEPTTHMRFCGGDAPVGLSESIALNAPSLCFKCPDLEALKRCITQHGMRSQDFPGYEGAALVIRAPEGTTLFVFREDFLGEKYEVDESGDVADFPGME